jgi:hypothetical protein
MASITYFNVTQHSISLAVTNPAIPIRGAESVESIQKKLESHATLNGDRISHYFNKSFFEDEHLHSRRWGLRTAIAVLNIIDNRFPFEAATTHQLRLNLLIRAVGIAEFLVPGNEKLSNQIYVSMFVESREKVVASLCETAHPMTDPIFCSPGQVIQDSVKVLERFSTSSPQTATAERERLVKLTRDYLLPSYDMRSARTILRTVLENDANIPQVFLVCLLEVAIFAGWFVFQETAAAHGPTYWCGILLLSAPYLFLIIAVAWCNKPGVADFTFPRMPAAAGIGFAALLTGGVDWLKKWYESGNERFGAPGVLFAVALGILMLEARANGAGSHTESNGAQFLNVTGSAIFVTLIFWLHSFVITCLALLVAGRLGYLPYESMLNCAKVVESRCAQDGTFTILLPITIASLILVIGVLVQTLWDEVAITAPLSRSPKAVTT